MDPGQQTPDLCATSPSAGYRGVENHLYRVEVHHGGKADDPQPPTFKWSRDNGSVVKAWLGTRGTALEVANVRGFRAGNWVELGNDEDELVGRPGLLVRIAKVEGNTLTLDPGTLVPSRPPESTHPKVRRWDHTRTEECPLATDNAVPIQESGDLQTEAGLVWLDLEDGIQVAFAPGGDYRTGDYWLIPARVATRRIEWPTDGPDKPRFLPRHGVKHHYAPLAIVERNATGVPETADLRCGFEPCSTPVARHSQRTVVIGQPPRPGWPRVGGGEAGDVTPGKKPKPSPKKPA